jgi:hypothetical protein
LWNVSNRNVFLADHDVTNLEPYIQAIVFGLPVNYSLPQTNACKTLLDRTCPLKKDEKVTYLLQMPILSVYPPVSTFPLKCREAPPKGSR